MTRASFQLPALAKLPPLNGAAAWLNFGQRTPADLHGKVVLVDFWTYTCINWLRTLPYIHAWEEKYRASRLVVVSVHTPEFSFEHNIDNVEAAAKRFAITYPIAIDNNYAIWDAFDNHFWPALYFIDAAGRIRYRQFGEGEYDMAERVIQQLLVESGAKNVPESLADVKPSGFSVAADWENLQSPETYLGYSRGMNFASPGDPALGRNKTYEFPAEFRLNSWALHGSWTITEEAVILDKPGGKLAFYFHARDLNLVMGPVMRGSEITYRVALSGGPPRKAHGIDIDAFGNGASDEQRLYQFIRHPAPIADRRFEIEFPDPGVQALAFTFG
jgi:thiol-disulfide isomerase/thioredoxin